MSSGKKWCTEGTRKSTTQFIKEESTFGNGTAQEALFKRVWSLKMSLRNEPNS